jgi:hypothetical protein
VAASIPFERKFEIIFSSNISKISSSSSIKRRSIKMRKEKERKAPKVSLF